MEDGHRRAKHRGRQETTLYLRNTFETMGGEVEQQIKKNDQGATARRAGEDEC